MEIGVWNARKYGFSYHGWFLWIKNREKNLSNDETRKWRLLIASSLNVAPSQDKLKLALAAFYEREEFHASNT